ncbi:MAG: aminopeptidase P family protein [Clostridiales bacterium]|nr:aminopeptidase P family protein [Clostridiales bacterium]
MAAIKTADEIQKLKAAAKAGNTAFACISPLLVPGRTEREIARLMEGFAREAATRSGGVWGGLSFPPIIASGPNGASPHAELTDRALEAGDFVTIDFGVLVDGYASDKTRTYGIGEVSDEQRRIYGIVEKAQKAGLTAARAGLPCRELDAVCRTIIAEAGYGEYFVHTTGHGVGTEVHEDPRIGKESEEILAAGMVVTIEPGIYIEGWGGVRIEDTAVILESGCEVITGG